MKYVAKHYTLNQSVGQRPEPEEKNYVIEGDKQFTTEASLSLPSLFVQVPSKFFSGLWALANVKLIFHETPQKVKRRQIWRTERPGSRALPLG